MEESPHLDDLIIDACVENARDKACANALDLVWSWLAACSRTFIIQR